VETWAKLYLVLKSVIFFVKLLILTLPLFLLISCSEPNYESRELPTKYPESATMGSAEDAAKGYNP
jgi:hypothetical protein